MTPEELQQIQAIVQTATAPLAQQIQTLSTETKQEIQSLRMEVKQSEQKILTKLDQLEKLSADYLDGRVQTVTRRVDRIEKHLNLTPQ